MEVVLPSEPSKYSTLIKKSLRLYTASFFKVILFSLLLSVAVFIPRLMLILFNIDFFVRGPVSFNLLWLVLIDLFSLILFIAIIWHMHCKTLHFREPLVRDFIIGIQKVFQVIVASIVQSTVIFAAILFFFGMQFLLIQYQLLFTINPFTLIVTTIFFTLQAFAIIYLISLFIFFLPLIATENKGILAAIEKSVYLVWNYWWKVMTTQMTPWIIYILILLVLNQLFRVNVHIYFTKPDIYTLRAAIINMIVFTFFIPWVAALLLVQLHDLELRKHALSPASLNK